MARTAQNTAFRRWTLRVGIAALVLAVLYFALSVVIMRMALTPLRKPHDQTPVTAGLKAEALTLESAKDRTPLAAFFIRGRSDRAIVMVHGLDSNCWDGNDRDIARVYLAHGYSVMLFDLRGQGSSGGKLLGLGWKERDDVLAAVRFLQSRGFKPGKIGIHGSSYGAGTAILAAAYIPEVGAVVADSPFADIRDMMSEELMRKVGNADIFLPGIILAGKFLYGLDLAEIPPIKAAPLIAPRPLFILHGEADSRIPVDHSRRIYAAAKNPRAALWTVPGAEHTKEFNDARPEFIKRTTEFFDRSLR
jgi:dipeptidyl aminopeptidase/acylaminoacyl peptidase